MSFISDLADFFEEFEDLEISIQPDRNYSDPKKISKYVRDLEDAIAFYTGQRLDLAIGLFKRNRDSGKIKAIQNPVALRLEIELLREKMSRLKRIETIARKVKDHIEKDKDHSIKKTDDLYKELETLLIEGEK